MRYRKIVKHGNSYYILLSKHDILDYDLKVNQQLDVEKILEKNLSVHE